MHIRTCLSDDNRYEHEAVGEHGGNGREKCLLKKQ